MMGAAPSTMPSELFDYLRLYLVFSAGLHVIEEYLEWRQLRQDRKKTIPPEVFSYGILDEKDKEKAYEKFEKARQYNYDKRVFGMVCSWINFLIGLVMLLRVKPWVWRTSMELAEQWNFTDSTSTGASREVPEFLVFHFLTHYIDLPLGLVTSLYSDFVLEEKHGFNKKTMRLFVSDLLKSELLSTVFTLLLIPVLIHLVHYAGELFYIYLWAFLQVFGVFMMWLVPNYIMPLFNTYEPIKDAELKTKIEDLAGSLSFPLYKIFQMDGSTRSAHSNAFFFGIWKYRRIVLYDTLLHLPHDAILAILGHELGHWKKGHTLWNLVIGSVQLFCVFYIIGMVLYSPESAAIFASFGMQHALHSKMMGVMLISMLLEPLDTVLDRAMTCLTRVFEFQADRFANVELNRGPGLKQGLIKLADDNKSGFNEDPLWAWYNLSHPTLLERLKAIDADAAAVELTAKKDK
ncbi:unnamed protein product [Amoebophrya sp. A120]|nr:unnamed protein product [Amoebophrya sp. A120]|eukprot:GSA120T00021678001.1